MSTFMANKGNIVRKWYILTPLASPSGKPLPWQPPLLRGKHKPEYTPPTPTAGTSSSSSTQRRQSSPARSWIRSFRRAPQFSKR